MLYFRYRAMYFCTYKFYHYVDDLFLKRFSGNLLKVFGNLNSLHLIHTGVRRENFTKFVRKPTEKSAVVLSHSTLITLLKNCKSVSEQIEVFQSYSRLSDEDIAKRISLCNNIENIFRFQFPDCAVHLVGSSISGLGSKGSDVDLSFLLSKLDITQNKTATTNSIPNVDVARGNISVSDFPSLTVKQQLLFLQRILKHEVAVSSTIIPGRHPILNFKFDDLGCDLSINNWAAFECTKLMKLCMELDYRILPLYRLLSYWGKRFKLIGGPLKFKSYSLFLMVVYFLQTRSNPILPTIQEIFIKAEFLENLDNWSYDISQYIEKFQQSINTSDLETLFREFFFFYSNFDFSSIICPLNTKLIDAKSYVSEDPQFELNTISIQDPFDCHHNVTTGVNWKYCKKLIRSLLATCDVYDKCYQHVTADKNWGIAAILDVTLTEYSSETDERSVEIEIPLKKYAFFENDSERYLKFASDKVFSILRNGLLFQCNNLELNAVLPEISKVINSKYRFRNGQNGEVSSKEKELADDSEHFLISKVLCTTADTWMGRSNYFSQNVLGEENNFIACEGEISRKILKSKLVKEKEAFHFVCECFGTYKENIPCLKVNMVSVNDNAFIPKLRIFLKEYILNYSRTYL